MNELQRSFTEYVQEYRAPMFRVARSRCRDSQTAEDVVQDVLLRFWIKWPQEGGRIAAAGIGYAVTATKNAAIDQWRKSDAPSAFLQPGNASGPDADDDYAGVDILHVVAELDDTLFRLIVLHKIERWTIAETARHLGLSETTARRYLTKALEILQDKLKAAAKEGQGGR